jgi:hypothetical protein
MAKIVWGPRKDDTFDVAEQSCAQGKEIEINISKISQHNIADEIQLQLYSQLVMYGLKRLYKVKFSR